MTPVIKLSQLSDEQKNILKDLYSIEYEYEREAERTGKLSRLFFHNGCRFVFEQLFGEEFFKN